MRKFALICFGVLFFCNLFSQIQNANSLVNILNTSKLSNKEQIYICKKLCFEYERKNIEKFRAYSEKGLLFSLNENDKTNLAHFYLNVGISHEHYGKRDSALLCYEVGLEWAQQTRNKKCEALICIRLGFLHLTNIQYRDINKSLTHLLHGLQLAEKTEDKQIIVLALNSIGEYYRFLRNFERCIYYTKKSEKISDEINFIYGKILNYYTISGFFYEKGEIDKSIDYDYKMLELTRISGDKENEAKCLQSLAYNYCLGKGELRKAESYATECLQVAEEFGAINLRTRAYTALSFVYLYQKRFEECKIAVLKAWNLDSLNIQLSTLTNLAAAHLYLGELDEAHSFFVKYVYFLEEFSGNQFQKAIADMDVKYETEKKELRISVLEVEKKFYTLIALAGIIVSVLIFGLFLFRQRLNVQKRKMAEQRVMQLEQEKQLIATQAVLDGETAERSRLARDLHDGLGGMLSVVKLNLKDMKHFAVMDGADYEYFEKALDMLDQSIGELRRVAHHIMPESLVRYGLKVSLEDFCRAISNAHFQYLGEDSRLDSRLEVVIYRCAYELINNAAKHAHAATINVQLVVDKGIVSLTVCDNGVGFDPQTTNTGIGLENIRNRIAVYNGKMTTYSSPEQGTEISIEFELIR
jgi:signal transduction histidine kinase